MEQMSKALDMAKEGHGQMVAAVGEAGVGKSRLCYEFKLISQRGCLVLETFSVSHGKAYPYLPLIELLKNYFQVTPKDDERRRREKVGGRVLMLDRTLEDTLPYFFSLLGVDDSNSSLQQMDAQVKRQRTFEAIKRLLVRESLNQTVILIFEDLHWLDSETETFLGVLCESLATAQILLLVNYRPEYRHEWGSKTYYTQLRLDPLDGVEAQELLTALVGERAELRGLRHLILEKTEGNPFFIEEIVQTLAEEEVLVGERGDYRIDKAPTELRISPTVQGVLTARMDRLGAEEKELLQTLAVVGKEFSLSLLGKVVTQPEEELYRLLSHLQGGEFIFEQLAFPEVEYVFKHALTQEVVYSSVLMERRRVLHERVAQAIEEVFSNLLEEHYDELAHHYSRSSNTKKAVDYLLLAAQQEVQRSSNPKAISHLVTALELVKTLPDAPERLEQEFTLQITMGIALQATQGFASREVENAYIRARKLAEQAGDPAQISPALQGLWQFYILRAELHRAYKLGEQLLHLAHQAPDLALHPVAYRALGESMLWQGEFSRAREHLERGVACYDSQQHRSQALLFGLEPGVVALCFSALSLWFSGFPDRAHKKIQEALALAQEASHLPSMAEALNFAIIVHHLRRECQATRDRTEALITLSTEQGFPFFLAFGTIFQGWALAYQGNDEEGIQQMRQGIDAWRITGVESVWPYIHSQLAEAYGRAGKAGEGLTVVAEVLDTAHKSEENWYISELYRLKGELLMAQKDKNEDLLEAEACFHKAIDIARRQEARSWELRAVMSLCHLWQQQGKKEEARHKLSEIFGWFTEGFDTSDLVEAKTLLEKLSD
jgi:predicted ATPase